MGLILTCRGICSWQVIFDLVVYSCIICSCIFLVITPPREDDPGSNIIVSLALMEMLNAVFTIVFIVEFLVRISGQGFIFTKNAYFNDAWNRMDLLVLTFACIEISGVFPDGKILKIARLARSLRPLRLMKRNAGMRVVIDALLCTMVPVSYVFLFATFTFVVFALIGQGLFGGKLARCQDSEPGYYGVMPGTEYPFGKTECSGFAVVSRGFMVPVSWITPTYNFDTTYNSMLTLFRVNTIKYVAIIYDLMDITEPGLNPVINASMQNAMFVITYLFVGGLFVMNLFVGFIIDGFNANKGSSDAEVFYGRFLRQIVTYRPKYDRFPAPKNNVSASLRVMIKSNYFELFSGLCVMVNLVFMLTGNLPPPAKQSAAVSVKSMAKGHTLLALRPKSNFGPLMQLTSLLLRLRRPRQRRPGLCRNDTVAERYLLRGVARRGAAEHDCIWLWRLLQRHLEAFRPLCVPRDCHWVRVRLSQDGAIRQDVSYSPCCEAHENDQADSSHHGDTGHLPAPTFQHHHPSVPRILDVCGCRGGDVWSDQEWMEDRADGKLLRLPRGNVHNISNHHWR